MVKFEICKLGQPDLLNNKTLQVILTNKSIGMYFAVEGAQRLWRMITSVLGKATSGTLKIV